MVMLGVQGVAVTVGLHRCFSMVKHKGVGRLISPGATLGGTGLDHTAQPSNDVNMQAVTLATHALKRAMVCISFF